ncbi:O-antigen translocase [Buttiauxella gaviniae]|uniref:O-antigen translocase n=1 Tax=Buttiauxella gaviniae TaxID=82990 RepID=UPI0039B0919A
MTLIKTSFLNLIAIIVKVLTGILLNKVMAIYVGPAGYALASQFQNGINFVLSFATGGINTGVTKYTAEYSNDLKNIRALFKTSVRIAFISCCLLSSVVFIFSRKLSVYFLHTDIYQDVFRWFSLTVFLFVANILLTSIVNGKKLVNKYVLINIIGNFISLCFSLLMIVFFGLKGAFIAFATNQSLLLFVTIYVIRKETWFKLENFIGKCSDTIFYSKLLRYSLMAIVSAFCVTLLQILIRNYIVSNFGWQQAGYWDGVWRISSLYLMVVTVPLGIYYLPKLSEIKSKDLLVSEIVSGYKIVFPCVVFCSAFIYFFRDIIITLLFANDFKPMRDLMAWQLVGDVMKLGSWLVSYIMISKALTKTYIITEISTALLLYCLVVTLCKINGLQGVTQAYCITYTIYWLVMICIMINYLRTDEFNEK